AGARVLAVFEEAAGDFTAAGGVDAPRDGLVPGRFGGGDVGDDHALPFLDLRRAGVGDEDDVGRVIDGDAAGAGAEFLELFAGRRREGVDPTTVRGVEDSLRRVDGELY